jgi:hypothetical protein
MKTYKLTWICAFLLPVLFGQYKFGHKLNVHAM